MLRSLHRYWYIAPGLDLPYGPKPACHRKTTLETAVAVLRLLDGVDGGEKPGCAAAATSSSSGRFLTSVHMIFLYATHSDSPTLV